MSTATAINNAIGVEWPNNYRYRSTWFNYLGTAQPNYVGPNFYDPNPYTAPNPNPYPNWWDQNTYTVPAQTKYFVNCPHCGRNVENTNWVCSNCKQSLFTIPAAAPAAPLGGGTFQFTWPPIPAIPQSAPPASPEPRKTLPLPTPEPKDSHAGDGLRWDDI